MCVYFITSHYIFENFGIDRPQITKLVFRDQSFRHVMSIKNETDPVVNDGENAIIWQALIYPKNADDKSYTFTLVANPSAEVSFSNIDGSEKISLISKTSQPSTAQITFENPNFIKRLEIRQVLLRKVKNEDKTFQLYLFFNKENEVSTTFLKLPPTIDSNTGVPQPYLHSLPFNIMPGIYVKSSY